MMDFNGLQQGFFSSAEAIARANEELKKSQIRREQLEFERSVKAQQIANQPLVEALQEQNKLLKEENDRQKEQLKQAQENEKLAKAEAKKSKRFGWITFIIATIISIASLIVAIVK